jgi:hypothetical protein
MWRVFVETEVGNNRRQWICGRRFLSAFAARRTNQIEKTMDQIGKKVKRI